MAKVLKFDLHTHLIEALKEKMDIRGILDINKEAAAIIVKAIKSSGLNGVAVTEKNNFNFGWVVALQIMDFFKDENLIILPGSEITYAGQHFLSIYIPPYVRRSVPFFQDKDWYLILAHPGFYQPLDPAQLGALRFDAVESVSLLGDFALSASISKDKQIPLIRASDAHSLDGLGFHYTEMESSLESKKHRYH